MQRKYTIGEKVFPGLLTTSVGLEHRFSNYELRTCTERSRWRSLS
ncbi:MAG: hypothetical protein V7K97_18675 [Nostoc sp.]